MAMSRQAQMKLLPPSTGTKNQILIFEGFNQLNQTEEPKIMELDDEINIQEPPLTCKTIFKTMTNWLDIILKELSKILAIIDKHFV
jgi:hypothetical protein